MDSNKTKVLHIINGEFYAGAERVQDLLALKLPSYGYEIGFACLKPRDFPTRRMAKDAPLYSLPMNSRFGIGVARKLVSLINKEQYNIIHTHTPRSALIGRVASLISGIPMVHHVHSPTLHDTEDKKRNRINAKVERVSLLGVRYLVAVSGSIEKYLLNQGYHQQKITVIRNGVPSFGELEPINVPIETWTIGCVAYYRPRKGLEILLKAVADLLRQGFNVKINIVGGFETSDYETSIKNLATKEGINHAVEWIGSCSSKDIVNELKKMDIFALPSLYGEGLPMVVLEAMAAGLPVVASDIDGVPEVINDRVEGFLIPPSNHNAMSIAIKRIISGEFDYKQMCIASYRRHFNEFSDVQMASKVAQLYNMVEESRVA